MISVSQFRQLRVNGLGYDCAAYPLGLPGAQIDATPGREWVEFRVAQTDPGVAAKGVMRSEIAGFTLPRFGGWKMRVEFCVPKFWRADQWSSLFAFSAMADPADIGIHNSPLAFLLYGDELRCAKRSDANDTSLGNADSVPLGSAKLIEGRWHSIEMDVNFSWLADGHVHATLDGKTRLAADAGPNCYADQVPPFPCFGLYWSRPTGDPMRMLVREFTLI